MPKHHGRITLTDTIKVSVAIKRIKPLGWEIKQRVLTGPSQDNAQNPAWIRIDNSGPKALIGIRIYWADTLWPHYRRNGYQKIGGQYSVVKGKPDSNSTAYRIEVPAGVSFFGNAPWYSNEDAERFLAGFAGNPLCRVRVIGKTAQGREIKCLTISAPGKGRRQNAVVMGRTHANETPGSYAVEGTAKYLLNDAAGRRLLKKWTVHLFPVVNPDGVAAGIKLTRIAPNQYNEFNMFVSGMTSPDLTMKSLRAEILKLKPACLVDHHSYLSPMPMAGFMEKRVGAELFAELYDESDPISNQCYMVLWPRLHSGTSIVDYCRKRFKTTVVVPEIPWNYNRIPADIERLGVKFFRAAIRAHAIKMTS